MNKFISKKDEIYSVKLQLIDLIDEFERLSEDGKKYLVDSVNMITGNKIINFIKIIENYL